jgi:enoyl reductase
MNRRATPRAAIALAEIHWTGTGANGEQTLPDGMFGGDQDVAVQEIQAINR